MLFALLALLWIAVLVPGWVKRRNFHREEQNAARVQRTLHLLAETAEIAPEHRVEATAKQALAHQRILRAETKRQEAEQRARLNEAKTRQQLAELQERRAMKQQRAATRAHRLQTPAMKRIRVLCATIVIVGVLGTLTGAVLAALGQGASLLGWSVLAAALSFSGLIALAPGRLERRARQVQPIVAEHAPGQSEPVTPEHDTEAVTVAEDRAAEHAAHEAAQARAAVQAERARTRARARAEAERAARAAAERENQPDSILLSEARSNASPSPEQAVEPKRPGGTTSASPEPSRAVLDDAQRRAIQARLRGMGVVEDTTDGAPDLGEMLRRRRAAG